jgi:hypothetical protein
MTIAGVSVLGSAVAAIAEQPWKTVMEPVTEVAQLPHHGQTPIFFTATSTSSTAPASVVYSMQIPRGFIDDVSALILRHGGF